MYLLSIWCSGGLWIVPLILFIPAIIFFISGYRSSKSGSLTGGNEGNPVEEHKQNVSFFSTWQFKFGIALLIAAIIAFFWISSDYKGVEC